MCSTVGPCCFSILCIAVCTCQPQTLNPSLPYDPRLLGNHSLFSVSVSLFHRCVHILFVYLLIYLFILEKEMAAHSSILAWRIPWTEEPVGLQSTGSQRVGHDWATSLSLSCIGEGNGNPLQCACLENPRDGGAWWAAIYGVAQSWTRLRWLSSSSSASRFASL